MKLVLILHNVLFNGLNYLRRKCVAMGTKSASNFANVFMGHFEESMFTTASGSKGLLSHGGDVLSHSNKI